MTAYHTRPRRRHHSRACAIGIITNAVRDIPRASQVCGAAGVVQDALAVHRDGFRGPTLPHQPPRLEFVACHLGECVPDVHGRSHFSVSRFTLSSGENDSGPYNRLHNRSSWWILVKVEPKLMVSMGSSQSTTASSAGRPRQSDGLKHFCPSSTGDAGGVSCQKSASHFQASWQVASLLVARTLTTRTAHTTRTTAEQ